MAFTASLANNFSGGGLPEPPSSNRANFRDFKFFLTFLCPATLMSVIDHTAMIINYNFLGDFTEKTEAQLKHTREEKEAMETEKKLEITELNARITTMGTKYESILNVSRCPPCI